MTNSSSFYSALHMGLEDGLIYTSLNDSGGTIEVDVDYLRFLKESGATWVGFCVAISLENSMDDTVDLVFPGQDADPDSIYTISADNFDYLMGLLSDNGFSTYVNVNFETSPNSDDSPLRYLLGTSYESMTYGGTEIDRSDWPWDIDHPDHAAFVANFWQSYTDRITFWAERAEQAGVDMFGIGTEIDAFIRNGSNEAMPDDFSGYLANLIAETREVFTGVLTYDQSYQVRQVPDYFASENFWEETGLDVIGISAYYELLDEVSGVSSVELLATSWEEVFQQYLIPLQVENPGKDIVFTEFGYTDSIYSPTLHSAQASELKFYSDENGNGLDDGEEVQANIFRAFFEVNREHGSLVRGVFPWIAGGIVASDAEFAEYNQRHGFAIRNKLAQDVFGDEYQIQATGWTDAVAFHEGDSTNNSFTTTEGVEFFIGGGGLDMLRIAGNMDDFDVVYTSKSRFTITSEGSAGTVYFTRGVEVLEFDDQQLVLHSAPEGVDGQITTREDKAYRFSSNDFAISDIDNDGLKAVMITAVPETGKLKLDGEIVSAGTEIQASQLGQLVWTPPRDRSGANMASIEFRIIDDGDTSRWGEATDPTANTLTISVRSVVDRINGTRHGETLRGTQEGDIFFAKGGKDILFGEDGNDRFVFKRGDGFDRIGDFTNDSSQQDLIDLSHMNSIKNFRDLMRNHLEARDGSIFIEGGKHDVLMLAGNDMSQIEKDCFVF